VDVLIDIELDMATTSKWSIYAGIYVRSARRQSEDGHRRGIARWHNVDMKTDLLNEFLKKLNGVWL